MAPKSKSDKFNPMDLTSSSLSITPVNEHYQKTVKTLDSKDTKREIVQDTISITPCAEGTAETATSQPPQSVHVSQQSFVSVTQIPGVAQVQKPLPLKHRILQDSLDTKEDKSSVCGEKYASETRDKTERKEKKEKREVKESSRHKSSSHDSKKKKKEHKVHHSHESESTKPDSVPSIPSSLSKEEQEQIQIEETVAATNFLSQIINDDVPPARSATEKRKDSSASLLDEITGNMIVPPPTEQENDVQMVMRSLKELQELQEMKYSPSHSPVSVIQKPSKSSSASIQYNHYSDDYQQLYHVKEEKLRVPKKEDSPW